MKFAWLFCYFVLQEKLFSIQRCNFHQVCLLFFLQVQQCAGGSALCWPPFICGTSTWLVSREPRTCSSGGCLRGPSSSSPYSSTPDSTFHQKTRGRGTFLELGYNFRLGSLCFFMLVYVFFKFKLEMYCLFFRQNYFSHVCKSCHVQERGI